MKFLITGGAGFIGTYLCKQLVNCGDVYSIDNYTAGSVENHIDNVQYINADTNEFDTPIVDVVYHLGEMSRIVPSFDNFQAYHRSNIDGTFNVIQYCLKTGAKLIYAASSAPLSENGTYDSPYAYMKEVNVGMIERCGKWFDLQYAITYFYNVYGNDGVLSKYSSVIDIFKETYLQSKPLPVVLPGTQLRTYTHISDIVDGLIRVKDFNGKYHFGTTTQYNVFDVVNMFESEYTLIPERPGDRLKSADPDLSACCKLNWKPKVELPDWIESIK